MFVFVNKLFNPRPCLIYKENKQCQLVCVYYKKIQKKYLQKYKKIQKNNLQKYTTNT